MDDHTASRPVAVITGGAGDLAVEIAGVLRPAGYEVHAPGRDVLDVTCSNNVEAFFKALPRVDLLIHAAGICRDQPVLKMAKGDFDDVVDVSLTGAFRVSRAVLRGMSKRRGGHIVFIGSYSAWAGPPGQSNYAAAKAGLVAIALSLAKEYGPRNVRVNVVFPGFMDTKMTAALKAEVRDEAREAHCLGRFNTPSAVAEFIHFLDQRMPHTSGQVFNLDSRIHRWT
jgi:3-oxoacyl-[acyl-carrier protein] reductase